VKKNRNGEAEIKNTQGQWELGNGGEKNHGEKVSTSLCASESIVLCGGGGQEIGGVNAVVLKEKLLGWKKQSQGNQAPGQGRVNQLITVGGGAEEYVTKIVKNTIKKKGNCFKTGSSTH